MCQRNPVVVGSNFFATFSQITLLHQDFILHLYSIDDNLAPIHITEWLSTAQLKFSTPTVKHKNQAALLWGCRQKIGVRSISKTFGMWNCMI